MIGSGFFALDWLNEEGSTSSVKEATLYLDLGYFGLFAALALLLKRWLFSYFCSSRFDSNP